MLSGGVTEDGHDFVEELLGSLTTVVFTWIEKAHMGELARVEPGRRLIEGIRQFRCVERGCKTVASS